MRTKAPWPGRPRGSVLGPRENIAVCGWWRVSYREPQTEDLARRMTGCQVQTPKIQRDVTCPDGDGGSRVARNGRHGISGVEVAGWRLGCSPTRSWRSYAVSRRSPAMS